jgi:hypothetical protein
MRKTTFAVGRTRGRSTLLVFVTSTMSPIVGPWTVEAIVSTN